MENQFGELTTHTGLKKEIAYINTSELILKTDTDSFRQKLQGFANLFLGEKAIPAGRFFVKQVFPEDSGEIFDETGENRIRVESKQIKRRERLKNGGSRVPKQYRIYTQNDERFAVITDLTENGKNFVWSTVDEKDIPDEILQKIRWEELAKDLINNALTATDSRCWIEEDTHIIVISDNESLDYLADLDKKPILYDQEQGYFDQTKNSDYSLRAVDITEAWKVFLKFAKHDPKNLHERAMEFWNIVDKQLPESNETLSSELLSKSMLSSGLVQEDFDLSKEIIEEIFSQTKNRSF